MSATVIAKADGTGLYSPSFIRQGGTYYVYANAADAGTPASGIASIKADVSAITAGATAVSLSAGSYSVGGLTYGFRSASLTAGNPLTTGSNNYTMTSVDVAGNSRLQIGFSVTVDNTAPAATDIQCGNGSGGAAGRLDVGDACVFTFSEAIDPQSILAGWTGASTTIVVRFTNSGTADTFAIWNAANTAQLNLGSVNTNGDYVNANVTAGASGTASTMVLGSNTITVTIGTLTSGVTTDSSARTSAWAPSTSAFDRAGNAMSASSVNEGGASDKDF